MVLERDTLRIREAVLYQAVVRWSTEVSLTENDKLFQYFETLIVQC